MIDGETQDWLNGQAAAAPARPPATFGEIAAADWAAGGLETPFGVQQPRLAAIGDLVSAYEHASGQSAPEAAAAAGYRWPGFDPDGQVAIVHSLAQRLPDAQAREVEPYADVDARASAAAKATEQEAADVGARTYGVTGNALAYATGFARTLMDPTTILGGAIGAPESGLLSNWILREAAVNSVYGGVLHELVAPQREELGLPNSGLLADMASSAAGGVAIGGLLRAGGWALGKAFDRNLGPRPVEGAEPPNPAWRANPAPPAEALPAMGSIEPADFNAAARFVEDRAVTEAVGGVDVANQSRDLMGRLETARQNFAAPIADMGEIGRMSEEAALNERKAQLAAASDMLPDGDEGAALTLARLDQVQHEIANATNADDRRVLMERRDELLTDTTPEALQAAALPLEQRRRLDAEQSFIQDRLSAIGGEREAAGLAKLGSAQPTPVSLGQAQPVPARMTPVDIGALVDRAAARIEAMTGGPEVAERARAILRRPLSDHPLPEELAARPAMAGGTSEGAAAEAPTAAAQTSGKPAGGEPAAPLAEPPPKAAPSLAEPPAFMAAQRADAERLLRQAPDLQISLADEAGEARQIPARQALAEADEDAAAARELAACIMGDAGEPAQEAAE